MKKRIFVFAILINNGQPDEEVESTLKDIAIAMKFVTENKDPK